MTKEEAIDLLMGNAEKATTHDVARALLVLPEKTMHYFPQQDCEMYSESLVPTKEDDFLEVIVRTA